MITFRDLSFSYIVLRNTKFDQFCKIFKNTSLKEFLRATVFDFTNVRIATVGSQLESPQSAITCLKLTIKALEQGVKYVQS